MQDSEISKLCQLLFPLKMLINFYTPILLVIVDFLPLNCICQYRLNGKNLLLMDGEILILKKIKPKLYNKYLFAYSYEARKRYTTLLKSANLIFKIDSKCDEQQIANSHPQKVLNLVK